MWHTYQEAEAARLGNVGGAGLYLFTEALIVHVIQTAPLLNHLQVLINWESPAALLGIAAVSVNEARWGLLQRWCQVQWESQGTISGKQKSISNPYTDPFYSTTHTYRPLIFPFPQL